MARSTISMGSTGPDVSDCQQLLQDQGYHVGNVDGTFGRRAVAAVAYFQSVNGLAIDGVVGPQTWAALEPDGSGQQRPTIQMGSTGQDVSDCQNLLQYQGYHVGNVDGTFGRRTVAAVAYFQSVNGLAIDGVVGPQTWAALETT